MSTSMASDSTRNSPVLFATEEDDVDMGWSWEGWQDPATQAILDSLTKDDLQMDQAMSDSNPSQSLHAMRPITPDCQSQSSYVMETPPPPSFKSLSHTAEPVFLAGLGNSVPSSQIMTRSSSKLSLPPEQLFSKRTKKNQKNTCRPPKMMKVPGFKCKLNGGDYMVVARDLDVLEAIDKALVAIKEKIPENTFISPSSVRALSLQLNQIGKIFDILSQNINLPLEIPSEIWEEMFTVAENAFYATREQLEQYKRVMLELTSSTDDLSCSFSRNLNISSGTAVTAPMRDDSSQRGRTCRASRLNASASHAIMATHVSSGNRRTSQSQPPRQRATAKRNLPSTQLVLQQTPALNASQGDLPSSLPAVVVRGRPKGSVGCKKIASRSKSLACVPSKQPTNAKDDLDDDDFYSPPQSLAFHGFGSENPVPQYQRRLRPTTKALPVQEASFQPPQTSSTEDKTPEQNLVTVDVQLEPNIVTVVEETQPLIPVTEEGNLVSVVNHTVSTIQSEIAVNTPNKDAVICTVQALAVSTPQEKIREGDDLDLFYSSQQSGSFEDNSQRFPDEVEEPLTQQIQNIPDHAVEVVIEDYSQRLPDEVEEPSSQLSTEPIMNPATGSRASSSPSERYKHISKLTHNLFTLRPFLLDGTLSPGLNNLQMNLLNRVFKGSLKADGFIEMNGFAFACIGDWIKYVAGIRYSSFKIHQKATLQLLYGEDGRALEDIIPTNKILASKGSKKVTPSKRRYNEIPVVVTRPIPLGNQHNTSTVTEPVVVTRFTRVTKQPSASIVAESVVTKSTQVSEQPSTSTVAEPVVNNDMQLVPMYPQISVRREADMMMPEEDEIELQLVPDEMLTHIRTIVTHSEAEYFPICECIEQYWNGSKPFPDFLLADLENW